MAWYDQLLPMVLQARLTGQAIPIPGTGIAIHPSGSLMPMNAGSLNMPSDYGSMVAPGAPLSPTPAPVGNSFTMPTINVTAPRLPANPMPTDYGSAMPPGAPLSPVAAPQPTQDPYRNAQMFPAQQRPQGRQSVANQAAAYRAQQGMSTDQLNAASLAAAQQGRTYLQQGPYPAGGNIVANALMAPPSGAGGAPIMLAPTQATPYSMPQQNGYTLNPNQGLY